MINFRYHLVSVTAIFLALAIGLVLGTTALNGPTMDGLSETVSSLRGENENLRDQIGQLEDDAAEDQNFAVEVAPATLADTLEEEKILMVAIGAVDPADVDAVETMLGYSRADNVGRLNFTDKFTDPSSSAALTDLVAELSPTKFEAPNNNDGVESMSALLAAALLGDGVKVDDRDAVIAALQELGMVEGSVTDEQASAVIIVTGETYSDTDAADRNANLLTFAGQFGRTGPTAVAAPTTVGEGNLISSIMSDAGLAEQISTVNNVAGPEGQLATILAITERVDGGVGHYGTGDDATSLVPGT